MPVQINEIVVSVQVGQSTGSAGTPPTNSDLDKRLKKAVDEIKTIVKAKNER